MSETLSQMKEAARIFHGQSWAANGSTVKRWADALEAAEAAKEKFQTERDAAEARVAELEVANADLLKVCKNIRVLADGKMCRKPDCDSPACVGARMLDAAIIRAERLKRENPD